VRQYLDATILQPHLKEVNHRTRHVQSNACTHFKDCDLLALTGEKIGDFCPDATASQHQDALPDGSAPGQDLIRREDGDACLSPEGGRAGPRPRGDYHGVRVFGFEHARMEGTIQVDPDRRIPELSDEILDELQQDGLFRWHRRQNETAPQSRLALEKPDLMTTPRCDRCCAHPCRSPANDPDLLSVRNWCRDSLTLPADARVHGAL
jgi:hypothetical protein